MNIKQVLVTGAAGFIGYHLSLRLLKEGVYVTGIDNMNPYYDVGLKESRLVQLMNYENFTFIGADISNRNAMEEVFKNNKFDVVVNLAAQAGVRYSLKNPYSYIDSNVVGFTNILECCRHNNVQHLVFASSSSVYGANTKMPFSVHDNVDHPVSLYAATKKANELMAHSYSHLYDLPCTGLRFFTVYGPWGRPDMALFLFTDAILEGRPIKVFNHGKMTRDFTYINDIIEGVARIMKKAPEPNQDWSGNSPDPGTSYAKYKIYNIGNNNPVELIKFIELIEDTIGKKADMEFLDLQPGDVVSTYADVDDLIKDVGFKPGTLLETGIKEFVNWYVEYYGKK
ncbi:MAG: NAD-dependent epimerase [Proteobacteria bacterium]|nr:NAD-dependent epimerase [Pseudomonadota bacterium]MBU4011056.1 NAD-dependent epimerase [Pseudomonadota bacterium]MBU4037467.1 NAD-dependent epimerase [Pseudomonadota bacterium]